MKKRKVVEAVPKLVGFVKRNSVSGTDTSVEKMVLSEARASPPNVKDPTDFQLEANGVPDLPPAIPFGSEKCGDNFLVDKNGRSVAITITQQGGGLKTSLVPIASKVVKAEYWSDERALGKKDNLVLAMEKTPKKYFKNKSKWEQLEYEMHVCKHLVESYVKSKTYGIQFDKKIGDFMGMKKSQVVAGEITPAAALRAIFDLMRGLLDLHIAMARARNEWDKFDQILLYKALDTMDIVQSETLKTNYYGAHDKDDDTDESCSDMEESDSWSGSDLFGDCNSTASSSELTSSEEDLKNIGSNQEMLRSVGFVLSAEEFGDNECSSSNGTLEEETISDKSSNEESTNAVSNLTTEGSNETKKAVEVHLEQKTLTRLLKQFDLGLTLLPESLRQTAFGYVLESRKAIDDCGCTAEAAMAAIQEKMGGLRTNAELKEMFAAATFSTDLDD